MFCVIYLHSLAVSLSLNASALNNCEVAFKYISQLQPFVLYENVLMSLKTNVYKMYTNMQRIFVVFSCVFFSGARKHTG